MRGLGVEAELGLGQVALAGACGSHNGEPDHVASVRKVLEAAGLDETALRCPPALPTDRTARARVDGPAAVYHNCSGKHAYMLAGSVVQGWAPERYAEPDHPLQGVVGDTLGDFAGVPIEHVGVDGCGVPVHAMPLRGLATAYARLGARAATGEDGPAAVVEAVRRHPFMLSGTGQLDTILLEVTDGRILAKVGAEATYGAVASPSPSRSSTAPPAAAPPPSWLPSAPSTGSTTTSGRPSCPRPPSTSMAAARRWGPSARPSSTSPCRTDHARVLAKVIQPDYPG